MPKPDMENVRSLNLAAVKLRIVEMTKLPNSVSWLRQRIIYCIKAELIEALYIYIYIYILSRVR
jgi:hypothetical protein